MEGRRTILVVDDDDDVREALELVLQDAGYEPVTAAHGASALHLLEAGLAPAMILLDLQMPVMDGWALWDRLQESASLRMLPVIVLTATGLRNGAMGSTLILPKPVDVAELLRAVATRAR